MSSDELGMTMPPGDPPRMAATPDDQPACPHCGRPFPWTSERAGEVVRCACGGAFHMPAQAGGDVEPITGDDPAASQPEPEPQIEDDDTYALNTAEQPPGTPEATPAAGADSGKCPNCNQSISAGAVVCVKCGFNLQEGRRMKTEVAADEARGAPPPAAADSTDKPEPGAPSPTSSTSSTSTAPPPIPPAGGDPRDPRTALAEMSTSNAETPVSEGERKHKIDLYVPAVLIAAGAVMHFLNHLFLTADPAASILTAVANTVFTVALLVPLSFLGMLIAVKLLGLSFGTLGMAVYKLMGIVLAPGAIMHVAMYLLPTTLGFFVGLFAALAVCCGLLVVLFELDLNDAILFMVIVVVLLIVTMLVGVAAVLAGIRALFG